MKTIAVQKNLPTRPNYNQNVSRSNFDLDNLDSLYSQGSIEESDPSPELPEVEIMPPPEKAIIEIIDVDAEIKTHNKVTTEGGNIEKRSTKLKKRATKTNKL